MALNDVVFSAVCLLTWHLGWLAPTVTAGGVDSALGAIVADQHVSDSALDVHRKALALPAPERYNFLADWVLPGPTHDSLRLAVDFTPTHPAPPARDPDPSDEARIELARQQGQARVQVGGNLVSPALDLLAVARELDRLPSLRMRVAAIVPRDQQQQRHVLALTALIEIELGRFDEALRALDALYPLVEANTEHSLAARSAELLAIVGANAHPQTRGFARDAAANLFVRGIRAPGRGPAVAWETQLLAQIAITRHFDRQPRHDQDISQVMAQMSLPPPLREWSPSSHFTAASRGRGHARAHWQLVGDRIENANSHADDFLYYHIALQGNYQVECDVKSRDFQNTQLVVGGQWAESLFYSRDKYDYGNWRRHVARNQIQPPLTKYRDWVHMLATVRDHVVTHYANGRELHRRDVGDDVDPWVALRSDSRQDGAAVDIRITGEPVIPTELRLTASPDLTGWLPYFNNSIATPDADWQPLDAGAQGGGIVGRRRSDLAGMHVERLVRYHRPMLEDGAIEYDFWYQVHERHVHPALDRLAMLFEPDGVHTHWITDGACDRTALAPDNVTIEPDYRRGPAELPLLENAWNRVRLELTKDTVAVTLNERLVFERPLEITNQRTFGLFHFADRHEARVRNVRWRGGWPRALPSVAAQQLASQVTQVLDQKRSDLPAAWKHDFVTDGLVSEKITVASSEGGEFSATAEGLRIDRAGGAGYRTTTLALNLNVTGDFDIVARFQQFDARPLPGATATAGLRVLPGGAKSQQCLALRRFVRDRDPKVEDRHVTQAVVRNGLTDGNLDWTTVYNDAQEATAGQLRVARRGKRLYFLFAEHDSPNFRLMGESEGSADPLRQQGVQLFTELSGGGTMSVVWQDVSVQAEQVTLATADELEPQRTLSVMNHDGTNLQRLLPRDSKISSPGSPAWSPDGKQIAFDDFQGSTSNSRIYLINADGGELHDLGIGNMPTFSPDGKRIAFSWGGKGVALMDREGTNRQVVDPAGWGVQWSPDGRIAYGRSTNLVVYDLPTKSQRTILEGEHATRYNSVYWNLGWSRDGKRICFMGRTTEKNRYEIAVVAAAGSPAEFEILWTSDRELNADFSWHPDGNRILFSLPVQGGLRLFTLDRRSPKASAPVLLPGQPPDQFATGADWSPDGKRIVFSSRLAPESP